MKRVLVAVLATVGAAAALACESSDRPSPTRGLSLHHARSASFLGREAVVDLRATDSSEESRTGGIVPTHYELGDGWYRSQSTGRWAVGDRATLRVHTPHPVGLGLFVESRSPQVEAIQVTVNGVDVGVLASDDEWSAHGIELPDGVLRPGINDVGFAFVARRSTQGQPSDSYEADIRSLFDGRSPTAHNLQDLLPEIRAVFPGATIEGWDLLNLPGVASLDVIRSLDEDGVGTDWTWERVAGGLSVEFRRVALVSGPDTFEPDARRPAYRRDRGALTVARSGTLFIPFDTRQRVESVAVAASTQTRFGRWADLSISLETGATRLELANATLDGWWGRSRFVRDVPLADHVGPGCVVVDVEVGPNAEPVGLDAVELVVREGSEGQGGDEPPRVLPAERPDIVLVVLDAARADHFGRYGYERNTTPQIDRLAAESLVFENAFATAAYTVASMPTMLTGLSFVDHGMFWRGHVLAEPIVTLAEWLQDAGYRTTCLSANPNNSIARGLAQGCERFEEFWRNTAPPRSFDPYRISERAIARLTEADESESDSPEFLLLHYVPPHEPYTPAAGFDIFGDEAYAGSYDGSRETVIGIDARRLHPTDADLAEVVSLYDGNLLTADDAVGRVLETLEARDRWDNTVVMIVSDHGEAFREHGRMSHNSTVYDEMIQIPFIVRLPGGDVPATLDTEGLVSLEDVVPTLLAIAGIDHSGVFSGFNLIAPGAADRRRAVVARTSGDPPTFAYRTAEWKLIEGARSRELYDLRTDPDERTNVYDEHLETALCLRSLLTLQLTRPPLGAAAGEGVELTDDDLDTLRSLGYVR